MQTFILSLILFLFINFGSDYIITKRNNNYIREGAGAFYPLIEIIHNNVRLPVIEKKGSWIKVELPDGQQGWIAANSIKSRVNAEGDIYDFSQKTSSKKVSRTGLAAAIKGLKGKSDIKYAKNYENLDELLKPTIKLKDFNTFRKPFFETENINSDLEIEDLDLMEFEYEQNIESQTIGYGIAGRLLSHDAVNDSVINKYLALVTNHLVASNSFYDASINTFLLSSDYVDGYSCPGGYIFITKGAIKKCGSEAELAGIIAHEMAHILRKHGLVELTGRKTSIRMENVFSLLEEETGENRSEAEQELEDMLMQGYEKVMHERLLSYEEEADKIAAVIISKAGYDCSSFIDYVDRISKLYKSSDDIFDSSYLTPNDVALRAESLKKFLDDEFEGEAGGLLLEERFLRFKSQL
ncbi:MAG: M48 family metalloprotease [Melioribacteraceae bacterium]|nr:M48 family metalloprotease [Melioribacteraceae bacterium]